MSNREEKEKFDILFSNFEKRKRNLKLISPVSRGEKKIEKRFSTFEKRKRKGFYFLEIRDKNEKQLRAGCSAGWVWNTRQAEFILG